ncbi:ATP-binding protein [Nocardia blacklockiae]|uniref:ATP-binding protein n=1 Tax=Nocardia blacklockiae TaxID=480036 RepID=UPI00189408C9|nr:LuxR C-terminal-related transcriptional regulator [Nocardia blacklockiae]MBF6175751.1 AAA family ATPase [Nocardia blacklockiae]
MPPHRPRRMGTPSTAHDFIGRERELERVATLLLSSTRLITVVGAGGIGKTRLVIEAAQRFHKARNTPVHWVRLDRLPRGADVAGVEEEVARSVVDTDFSGRSAWQALVDTLGRGNGFGRPAQVVLVMDNCEHVLAAAGAVITELLDAVPGLTVVATSREPIGWVDEQLVAIPPLTRREAVALFRRRAALTGHAVDGDRTAVAERICAHLHNYPLHIRLAAARLRRQPLSMILDDLTGAASDRRLRWPPLAKTGADERHHGIADVIAWSYDLCSPRERLLFERLSVFAAGYDNNPDDVEGGGDLDVGADLAAIRAICAGPDSTGARLEPDEIEGLLERLSDQSLVSTHLAADAVRYSLLESFRVFAQQRLAERADAERARLAERHRRYYRDQVTAAAANWFSDREGPLLAWARAAWDNLRLAIDGSLATPAEAVVGLEIAGAMITLRVPFFKGSLRESRHWAERALRATRDADPEPVELRVAVMAATAWISLCQGLSDEAERMLEQCVERCVPAADAAAWRADPVHDPGLPAPVEFASGTALMLVHQDVRALTVLARAREKFTASGDLGSAAMSELFEALAAAFLGTAAQALEVTARHRATAAGSGAEWAQSWAELAWAIAHTKYGDAHDALDTGQTTLARQVAMRDSWGAAWAVHIRAWTLAHLLATERGADGAERAREIARLLGGAAALRGQLGVDIAHLGPFATETDRAAARTREVLGQRDFEAAWAEGAALRPALTEVTALALGTRTRQRLPDDRAGRPAQPSPWRLLTDAERDVAVLAAAGWSNTAIATRRGSSHRTVDAQMASVLHKLMIRSREDILPLVPADHRQRIDAEREREPRGTRGGAG